MSNISIWPPFRLPIPTSLLEYGTASERWTILIPHDWRTSVFVWKMYVCTSCDVMTNNFEVLTMVDDGRYQWWFPSTTTVPQKTSPSIYSAWPCIIIRLEILMAFGVYTGCRVVRTWWISERSGFGDLLGLYCPWIGHVQHSCFSNSWDAGIL